jgi:hypothetical protein
MQSGGHQIPSSPKIFFKQSEKVGYRYSQVGVRLKPVSDAAAHEANSLTSSFREETENLFSK